MPSGESGNHPIYLGHADTYWHLSAAPELLALAGERLERHLAGDA